MSMCIPHGYRAAREIQPKRGLRGSTLATVAALWPPRHPRGVFHLLHLCGNLHRARLMRDDAVLAPRQSCALPARGSYCRNRS
jgi:hypothetical protein